MFLVKLHKNLLGHSKSTPKNCQEGARGRRVLCRGTRCTTSGGGEAGAKITVDTCKISTTIVKVLNTCEPKVGQESGSSPRPGVTVIYKLVQNGGSPTLKVGIEVSTGGTVGTHSRGAPWAGGVGCWEPGPPPPPPSNEPLPLHLSLLPL